MFWLIVGELNRKPKRELGKLEEVREGEARDVNTAVDPIPFLFWVVIVVRLSGKDSVDGDVDIGGK